MTFEEVAERVKTLPSAVPSDMLQFYALYKQATVGPNQTPQPGAFDFKAKAKWNAWREVSGLGREEAQTRYLELARRYGIE